MSIRLYTYNMKYLLAYWDINSESKQIAHLFYLVSYKIFDLNVVVISF